MDKNENTRGAMPLDILIRLWKEKLGRDDPLNPPNPLGETIKDTIFYLKTLQVETLKEVGRGEGSPKIICLCGSTRFTDIMLIKQWELTKQGNIVLSWCALPDWYFDGVPKTHVGDQEGVKEIVDRVHFRKIDMADEVLVINKDYYIGESTTNEIEYAKSIGKPVKYLVEALKSGRAPSQQVKGKEDVL